MQRDGIPKDQAWLIDPLRPKAVSARCIHQAITGSRGVQSSETFADGRIKYMDWLIGCDWMGMREECVQGVKGWCKS